MMVLPVKGWEFGYGGEDLVESDIAVSVFIQLLDDVAERFAEVVELFIGVDKLEDVDECAFAGAIDHCGGDGAMEQPGTIFLGDVGCA